jgi:hypothetical protein
MRLEVLEVVKMFYVGLMDSNAEWTCKHVYQLFGEHELRRPTLVVI